MNLCFLDFRLISKLSLRKVKLTCKVGGSQVLRPTPTGVRRSQAGNLSRSEVAAAVVCFLFISELQYFCVYLVFTYFRILEFLN